MFVAVYLRFVCPKIVTTLPVGPWIDISAPLCKWHRPLCSSLRLLRIIFGSSLFASFRACSRAYPWTGVAPGPPTGKGGGFARRGGRYFAGRKSTMILESGQLRWLPPCSLALPPWVWWYQVDAPASRTSIPGLDLAKTRYMDMLVNRASTSFLALDYH